MTRKRHCSSASQWPNSMGFPAFRPRQTLLVVPSPSYSTQTQIRSISSERNWRRRPQRPIPVKVIPSPTRKDTSTRPYSRSAPNPGIITPNAIKGARNKHPPINLPQPAAGSIRTTTGYQPGRAIPDCCKVAAKRIVQKSNTRPFHSKAPTRITNPGKTARSVAPTTHSSGDNRNHVPGTGLGHRGSPTRSRL